MEAVYTESPAKKSKHAKKAHVEEWTDIPV
jgi:hypothetical protein